MTAEALRHAPAFRHDGLERARQLTHEGDFVINGDEPTEVVLGAVEEFGERWLTIAQGDAVVTVPLDRGGQLVGLLAELLAEAS